MFFGYNLQLFSPLLKDLNHTIMAQVPNNTKFHFTHPNHPLVFHSNDHDYVCDRCKTFGSGDRFHCHSCQRFDLHVYCADCPETLSSFIHHHHLTLVLCKPNGARSNERVCDVCQDPVEGLFYLCRDCNFNAHLLCTQLPNELRHAADNFHPLKLQKPAVGSCAVCKMDCSSLWVYGCEICGLNIHLDCVFGPYDSPSPRVLPSGQERGGSTSRGVTGQAPYPGGGYPWNGGYPTYGNHGGYGYDIPYSIPTYPNYGYSNHGWGQSHDANTGMPPSSSSVGKPRLTMFALVGRLTLGVVSSVIFGFPIGF